jgi:hypothetical protein
MTFEGTPPGTPLFDVNASLQNVENFQPAYDASLVLTNHSGVFILINAHIA